LLDQSASASVSSSKNYNYNYISNEVRSTQAPTEYRPVTAYTATGPIIVNGVDINTGLYPVLNFQPEGAEYPYIYVPIAEFSKVGARAVWDEAEQVIYVTTDYYELQNRVKQLEEENAYLKSLIEGLTPVGRGNTASNIISGGFTAQTK